MTNEQIDELTKAPAGVAPTSDDPEVIYLEQRCCTDTIDGRRWTTDTLCFECDDDVAPTKYIRADLVRELAEEVKRLRAENALLKAALDPNDIDWYERLVGPPLDPDRKSTRLNSSH